MAYMCCPRCGLKVRLRASYLTLERCPRCLAKSRLAVSMFVSEGRREEWRRVCGEIVSGELVIRTTREPAGWILALHGELDLASAPALDQQLRAAEEIGIRRVVVDLSGLEFIDSAGLHVLLDADRRLREHGPGLVLRRGPRAVQRIFELTGTVSSLQFGE